MAHYISSRTARIGLLQLIKTKNYSTAGNLVNITKDNATGTTIVSMNRPPVNGLNRELLVELRESLEKIRKDGSKGVILTSSLPNIFSGGLDIMEMYKPDLARAKDFWNELQECWLTLYSLNIPTAAAINGSSPAGGCLLAMTCEYRVFVEAKYQIGLNETKLGIVAPRWFRELYIKTIGYRQAELALMQGAQFGPQEALRIGLVDELVPNSEEAISKCQKYIESYAKVPAAARAVAKKDLRGADIAWLKKNREEDTAQFINFLSMPQVQAALEIYIQALKKKKN